MNKAPEPFELKVMMLALREETEWVIGLRAQLSHLVVLNRRAIGGGFVTNFHCGSGASPVTVPRGENGLPVKGYPPAINAKRKIPNDGLVSFIIWLDSNGRIRQLEACSLTDDKWPEDLFDGFHSFQDDAGVVVEK